MKDFRVDAANRSQEKLEGDPDGISANHSHCLPTGVGKEFWIVLRGMTLLFVVSGLFLIFFAVVLLPPEEEEHDTMRQTVLAASSTVSGILVLLAGLNYQKWRTRKEIGKRYHELKMRFGDQVFNFDLENSNTWDKLKLVPDDTGFLAVDPRLKVMLLEGIRYRYIVRSEDVQSCYLVSQGGHQGVYFAYDVFGVTLDFVLSSSSLKEEFKRQTIGLKKPALYETIAHGLQIDSLPDAADAP